MTPIVDKDVERYLYDVLPPRDEVLAEMEAKAKKRSIPIVGPAVGRLLHQYALLVGAERVFEMGSAIGYSTIWLARAVGKKGKVYYSDGDPKNAAEARGYLDRAGVAAKVEVLTGDAIELLAKTKGSFDLIFNDVDKYQYPDVFEAAVPRVRSGGLFITDNSIWSGRVARSDDDDDTRGVREFNRLCYASDELLAVNLPLRDGVMVCLKR